MISKGEHQVLLIPLLITLLVSQGCAGPFQIVEPTLASEPQAISIEPLAAATMIRFESWSPDGRIFAYWTFKAEQLFDFSYPSGTLYFLDAHTGDLCSYPYPARYTGQASLAWQADGKVAVLSSDPPRLGTPCGTDFAVVKNPTHALSSLPDPSFSPDGKYRAITKIVDANSLIAETSILTTGTGNVENTIRWKYWDAVGAPGGGQWLTTDQFLIDQTLDRGPLLVTVGKGITQVAPEIFGEPFVCGQECRIVATGEPISGTDTYHLVLFGAGVVSNFPPIQLYHSESDQIEKMPFQQGGFFSPDGRWVIFYNEPADPQENRQQFQIWLRPVDPIGSPARLLATTDINPLPPSWSPDSTKLAILSSAGFSVFLLSDGSLLGMWETGDYESIELLWSLDSQSLALRGDLPLPGSQEALFLVAIP